MILGAILSALGFSGCGGGEESLDPDIVCPNPGTVVPMYGVVTSNFICDLKVTDEDRKPIKGIQMRPICKDGSSISLQVLQDTLYSDSNGKIAKSYANATGSGKLTAIFEDIDGDKNGGTFAADTAEFEIKNAIGSDLKPSYQVTGTEILRRK